MLRPEKKPAKKNVCVLFGGVSSEHEVSLLSARTVLDNIDTEKYRVFPVGIRKDGRWFLHTGENWELTEGTWEFNPGNKPAFLSPDGNFGLVTIAGKNFYTQKLDCVFPVLHGVNGEDGSIQGLAQLAKIPCVGCGMQACVCTMDKYITKLIAAAEGVRQAAYVRFSGKDDSTDLEMLADNLPFPYPVFVKPCKTGSSIGISKVKDREGLFPAVKLALRYDCGVLIEECVKGREIEVAVLGNREPLASACGEIVTRSEFYDYESKYLNDSAELLMPAPIPEEKSNEIRDLALRVFKAAGCTGMSRVDFFLTDSGEVVFNEINTIPGFTSISMYPNLFELGGIGKKELVSRLIEAAMEAGRNG